MTNVSTAAGVAFAIGTTATIDESSSAAAITDFQNDTFKKVGEVESVPSFGDTINPVNFTALADQRVRKFKGSRDAGTIDIPVAFQVTNQGQADMKAALEDKTQDDYNFRVTFSDATGGGTNTVVYFRGKVMSRNIEAGSVDNIVRATYQIGINSPIYQVDGS